MALQVWLPLTNSTNNNGVSSVSGSLTHSSITYGEGKFGKAIRIANYATSTATYPGLVDKTIWSVCCWIKINSADAFTNYQDFFTLGCDNGGASSGGLRIEHTSVAGAVQLVTPKSTTYGSNTNGWWTFTSQATMCKDQWGHFVIVNDGVNYKTYFNGVLSNTTAISTFTPSTSKLTGTLILGMSGTYCWMNDFRIYDHALSENEVKEIYKGLALHWRCNGNDALPNLVPNYGAYNSKEHAYAYTTNKVDGYLFLAGSHFICEPSTTYTFSVCCDGTLASGHGASANPSVKSFTMWLYLCNSDTTKDYINGGYDSPVNFTSNNYSHQQIGDKHIWKYTTTATQTHMSVRINNYSNGTDNVTIKYWQLKIEKGSINTPWCPNVNDSQYNGYGYNSTREFDTSGFNRYGAVVSTMPTLDADSPRYRCSYKYNGSINNAHYNNTTELNYIDNFSWSIWVKPNFTGSTAQYAFTVGRADAGAWGYGLQCRSADCLVFYGSNYRYAVATSNTEWTHIAFTKSGTTLKVYRNGVLANTTTFSGTNPTYTDGDGVGIGCFHYSGGNIYPYYGNISDFRIYATCLTDNDIKTLYNTAVSITNNGTLIAYEFIEE